MFRLRVVYALRTNPVPLILFTVREVDLEMLFTPPTTVVLPPRDKLLLPLIVVYWFAASLELAEVLEKPPPATEDLELIPFLKRSSES